MDLRRPLVRPAAAILLAVLAPLSARAGGFAVRDEVGHNFTVRIRENPVGTIPFFVPEPMDAATEEEKVAILIDGGHTFYEELRETQEQYVWFVGYLVPDSSLDDTFLWGPSDRLCLLLEDGRRIKAERILASQGDVRVPGPRIQIYPLGLTTRFRDIVQIYPQGERCTIFAAFPRRDARATWKAKQIQEVILASDETAASGP